MQKLIPRIVLISCILIVCSAGEAGEPSYPCGRMLNLDFQQTAQGLIPNKGFYPLHVPLGALSIESLLGENMLVFLPGESLDIPHSSLIQPDGSEWIVTVRLGAYPDGGNGMVLSQSDGDRGYAIYLKDGAPIAVVRTSNFSMILKEPREIGITDCRRKMTTVELRIMKDSAQLTINRKRTANVILDAPLNGEYMPIRIGKHDVLPKLLENSPGATPHGFSGAISALSIWRQ